DLLVRYLGAEAGAAEGRDHPCRNLGAEIGGDQQLLQLLQRRFVQPALLEDRGDALGQLLRAAREALLEPTEKPAERHQPAPGREDRGSATMALSVTPMARAATTRPGSTARASRTGAKCSLCPASSLSASTLMVRPTCAARNRWVARCPAARSRAARSRRTGLATEGIRAAGVPGRSL